MSKTTIAVLAALVAGVGYSEVVHYDVEPMSDVQRLPTAEPVESVKGGTVRIVLAKDEYEPGSFLLRSDRDEASVELKLSEFRSADGKTLPASALDLKVIKCWYQNRNAWYSYFGDTGFKLCPELLLNDENLIRVDDAKRANYARLTDENGRVTERWLNPPRQIDATFRAMRRDFRDAETLQPVALRKGEYKQFFLTVHAAKDTPAGVYRGEVKVEGEGGQRLVSVPVEVKVLDFVLPKPMCYDNTDKPFLVDFYSYDGFNTIMTWNGGDLALAMKQFTAAMTDYARHGQDMYWGVSISGAEAIAKREAFRKSGIRTDYLTGSAPVNPESSRFVTEARTRRFLAAAEKFFGNPVKKYFTIYGDEPPVKWIKERRELLEPVQNAGFGFAMAGGDNIYRKAGYVWDWHNVARPPESDDSTRYWNRLGGDQYVAWYANQHVGAENPSFNRRQNGIAAWLSGYSALCNYAHHFGPYNDDTTIYRPMVYAYGSGDGVIDTLQWEGFREGIDDIRYATLMVRLANKAIAAKNADGADGNVDVNVRYLGRQALQLLANFNRDRDSLNELRLEMANFILRLQKVVKL